MSRSHRIPTRLRWMAAWPAGVSGGAKVSSFAGDALARLSAGGGGPISDSSRLGSLATESPELLAAVDALPPLSANLTSTRRADRAEQPFHDGAVFALFAGPPLALGVCYIPWSSTRWHRWPGPRSSGSASTTVSCVTRSPCSTLWWRRCWRCRYSSGSISDTTFFTQWTAERMLFRSAGADFRSPATTFAELLRAAPGRQDHDADDLRRGGVCPTAATGLVTALVSLLTCGGIAVVLAVFNPALALAVSVVIGPLVVATTVFGRLDTNISGCPGTHFGSVRRYAGKSQRGHGQPGVQQAGRQRAVIREAGRKLLRRQGNARIELQARFFPFIDLLSVIAKAIALGWGRACSQPETSPPVSSSRSCCISISSSHPSGSCRRCSTSGCRPRSPPDNSVSCCGPSDTPIAEAPVVPGRLRGDIDSDHVTFAYESTGLVVMDDVSLRIPSGRWWRWSGPPARANRR